MILAPTMVSSRAENVTLNPPLQQWWCFDCSKRFRAAAAPGEEDRAPPCPACQRSRSVRAAGRQRKKKSRSSRLVAAAATGDIVQILRLLGHQGSGVFDPDGRPFFTACEHGHEKAALLLARCNARTDLTHKLHDLGAYGLPGELRQPRPGSAIRHAGGCTVGLTVAHSRR